MDAWLELQRKHTTPEALLAACEAEVNRCKADIHTASKIIHHVKTTQLYRVACDSWAQYCETRFGHTRYWADYQIKVYEQSQLALPPPEEPRRVEAEVGGERVEAEVMDADGVDGVESESDIAQRVKLPPDCTQSLTPRVANALYASQQTVGFIVRLGHQFRRHVAGIGESECGRYMPATVLAKAVKDVIAEIRERAPYGPCPYCRQGTISMKCKTCGGAGWVDKTRWDVSDKALR